MSIDLPVTGHFSIGEWIVAPDLNAISKGDLTVHLEPKVMKILVQLATAQGRVLSKEHLIGSVWPSTFVSDDALTRCISILRREMQDDSHAPRYIQTIPKTGYRLVAEVHSFEPPPDHHASGVHVDSLDSAQSVLELVPKAVPAKPRLALKLSLTAAVALILLAVFGLVSWRLRSRHSLPAISVLPFTSYAGWQDQGSFSPDGTRVVFVWSNPVDGNRNLFIKQIGSETLFRLTHADESDYSPAWSPDGTKVAYLAFTASGLGLYVVPSLGGPPQKLYTPHSVAHWDQRALSWSPDGKNLTFPDGVPSAVNVLSLDTLQAHPVTVPPNVWDGDVNPAYSPDGKYIAFARAIEGAVRDIYVVPASGGTPRQVTNDHRLADSLAWAPDSSAIIFSSDRGGKFGLWKVPVRGGQPQRLAVGSEDAYQPAVSLNNHLLLYTESSATWSILGIPFHPDAETGKRLRHDSARAVTVVSSTQQDSAPSFAPDGSRFAFQSWRSGSQELWIASRDGLTLRQLTSYGRGLTGSPSFSPDGQLVAFDARPEDHSHIFVVSANGGTPRRITTGNFNDILPRWSADGRFLYFASNRGGAWQSWKVALDGGQPQQITAGDGYLAMESPDGRWIYYTKGGAAGIWRIPATGDARTQEERVLPQPPDGYWGYWAVTAHGIYFLDATQPAWRIQLYNPDTRRISTAATLERRPPPFSGISVDRNGSELLVTDEVNASSHITLVQNFP